MDVLREVGVPIFQMTDGGDIIPNPLFHRSYDKLHSRCIEYPFAASTLATAGSLLDVGTAKADAVWVRWLAGLPIDVHATDYDEPTIPMGRLPFHRADVRRLPFSDRMFDLVFAVSVIEHIGLPDPQVLTSRLPPIDQEGDVVAVRELLRVLKHDGRLVMTFPFGAVDGLILGGSARAYTRHSLSRFDRVARLVDARYYEYQHAVRVEHYDEYPSAKTATVGCGGLTEECEASASGAVRPKRLPDLPGVVTWRNVPLDQTVATHRLHVDGVLCGVWMPM
jgi:SAM-dependent methyltransferase